MNAESGSVAGASPTADGRPSRGLVWLQWLSGQDGTHCAQVRSVLYADAPLGEETARFIAVVPDPQNHFPRARAGEVGLEEGWTLAQIVRDTTRESAAPSERGPESAPKAHAEGVSEGPSEGASGGASASAGADTPAPTKRPIVAIVDVSSQAYGRREELMGVHMACAAAADAYAQARLAGHPVIALIVGKAMSGAFLAHGYQANRIIALDDPGVLIHAMGQAAAARVTRRTVAELTELGTRIAPMSYDVKNYAKLGLLSALLEGIDPDRPDADALVRVRAALSAALTDIRAGSGTDLSNRYASSEAKTMRHASIEVRKRLAEQW